MRSIVLALAFAAPLSAVAATPNPTATTFTSPTSRSHQPKQEMVYMTFVNHTSQDREVVIDNLRYKINFNSIAHISVPVGSTVRVYSETNSKINGQELMTVSENDRDASVYLK